MVLFFNNQKKKTSFPTFLTAVKAAKPLHPHRKCINRIRLLNFWNGGSKTWDTHSSFFILFCVGSTFTQYCKLHLLIKLWAGARKTEYKILCFCYFLPFLLLLIFIFSYKKVKLNLFLFPTFSWVLSGSRVSFFNGNEKK